MGDDDSGGSLGHSRRAVNLSMVALFALFMISIAVEPVETTLNVIAFIGLGGMLAYVLFLVGQHFWGNHLIDVEVRLANEQNGGEVFQKRRAALAAAQAKRIADERAAELDPPTDPALEPVREEQS